MSDSKQVFVGIIGSAGRKQKDRQCLTKLAYKRMCTEAERIITDEFKLDWSHVTLVSGGAAWSDHVAVTLFEKHKTCKLQLFFPCEFKNNVFVSNSTANQYHAQFSRVMDMNSRLQLTTAMGKQGCEVDMTSQGFLDRNTRIAKKSQFMIAFTRNGAEPNDGGTGNTWSKCTMDITQRRVVSISGLARKRRVGADAPTPPREEGESGKKRKTAN